MGRVSALPVVARARRASAVNAARDAIIRALVRTPQSTAAAVEIRRSRLLVNQPCGDPAASARRERRRPRRDPESRAAAFRGSLSLAGHLRLSLGAPRVSITP